MPRDKPRRVSKKELLPYLIGSMGYSGSDRWTNFSLLKQGFQCYQTAVGSGLSHLPLFLVMDLRILTEFGNEFSFAQRRIPGFDALTRSLYENQILNRLLREFCVQQALEQLSYFRFRAKESKTPDHEFAPRADRLTQILLARLAPHWPKTHIVNAAHLRGISLDVPTEVDITAQASKWSEAIKDAKAMPELIEAFVHSATGAEVGVTQITWSNIVKVEDLFELEHLSTLNREYLRLQVRQLIDVRESLPVLDPHDIKLIEEVSEVESLFMDQSHYPTGGFSEITNRGSFENMVLSELVYMGEGALIEDVDTGSARAPLDLFDLRFVEGELLFYMRDSGQLQRKRRKLHFVLDMRYPLNIKYPEHPYQLETLVVGLLLALERDISILFANDAVTYSIHLLTSIEDATDDFPLNVRKLKEVLDILFFASIQRSLMQINIECELPWADMAQSNRKSYCIGFATRPKIVQEWSRAIATYRQEMPPLFGLTINLADGEEPLEEQGSSIVQLNLATTPLNDLKHAILEAILLSSAPAGSAHKRSA